MKQIKIVQLLILLVFVPFFLLCSCKKIDDNGSVPYNPNKKVTLDTFAPAEGGMATRVVLSGQNLGNDPSLIKVYFNDKRAPIIGCDKGRALVVTPRQPGEECTISVVIGKDSVTYTNKFTYHIRTTVTTLVGVKGSNTFQAGTFAEALFTNPAFLIADHEGNLFLSQWNTEGGGNVCLINISKSVVIELTPKSGGLHAPTTDITGKIIMIPVNQGEDYFMYNADEQWATRRRKILHPNADEQAGGMKDFSIDWKSGLAVCSLDKMIYTKSYSGQLVKFDPITRVGQKVADNIMSNSDAYLQFDPLNPEILYLCYRNKHCIYSYNIKTGEHKLFAGTLGLRGWKDGKIEEALFNEPCQMIFDVNNDMIIADKNNHCIRKITRDGIVSTIIGIGGKAGYQDGNPDDAMFNGPTGITIDKDYNIYIADNGNNCIRKLAIE